MKLKNSLDKEKEKEKAVEDELRKDLCDFLTRFLHFSNTATAYDREARTDLQQANLPPALVVAPAH